MTVASGSQPSRASRVLAALDGTGLPPKTPKENRDPSPADNGLKRKLPTTINEAIEEQAHKRRAVSGSSSPSKPRLSSGADEYPEQESHLPSVLSRMSVSPQRPSQPPPRIPVMPGVQFHLRYDNELPVGRIDRGGADQSEKLAEFVTKSIDNLSHGVTVKDGMRKLGLRDKRDIIPGLEVRLLPHQIIAVAWMVEQERESQYKGGILADDMGLGKTVQMIALMTKNQPDLDDKHRTTLIVVPAALLQQWKDEIESKSNGIFTVHIHHGKDKLKSLNAMKNKDVIVTTYQTLNSDFSVPSDLEDDEEVQWLLENGGLMARTKFYRVVLDEAQFIRNRGTRSSKSVAMLRSKYRWMLTGTPVTNTLVDIYGLIRFGCFRPWNDWESFDQFIGKMQLEDAPLAGMRAQEVLKPVILRRTKNSEIEGEPILQLPPKDIEIVKLEFSDEEEDIYKSFERQAAIRVNKFIRSNSLVKNNAAVLAMILRLRQLTCHPHLILSQVGVNEDPTLLVADDKDKELGRAKRTMGPTWVADIQRRFLKRGVDAEIWDFADEGDEGDPVCPVCHDLFMNDSGRILACGHEICFDCSLELAASAPVHDGIFGYGTDAENLKAEKEWDAAAAKGFRPCPTCKKMNALTKDKTFKSSAFEPTDEELAAAVRNTKRERAQRRRSKAAREPSYDSDEVMDSPSPSPVKKRDVLDIDDSDDDDLPDMAALLAGRGATPKKKKKSAVKKEASSSPVKDEDLVDLTMDDISGKLPPGTPPKRLKFNKKRVDSDSDSDLEVSDSPPKPSPKRASKGASQKSAPSSPQDKGKGKAKERRRGERGADGGPSDAVFAHWRNGADDLEPSTKMLALVRLLQEWDATGDKSICFSQWTSMLDLVEKIFARFGIRSLRYDGKMDRQSRDAALATFRKPGGPKVILISTRCGGCGLNLVSANRIINLDLSWNYAAESQAYDRVHRLGQDKDVFVKRLVVRNTIEERMLELQDVKVGLAEAALGEGTGAKLNKLSVKEIKQLFGMSKKEEGDKQGQLSQSGQCHLHGGASDSD